MGQYRLCFDPDATPPPEAFLGSAWRGAFGHALKHAVCVTGERECRGCGHYRTCAYPYIFETPPPPGASKMRRYPAAPHPFVLVLPMAGMEVRGGGSACIGLNLFGDAIAMLAHVIVALERAGEHGVGPGRARYRLLRVEQRHAGKWTSIFERGGTLVPIEALSPAIPPVSAHVRLGAETPLRLKREGRVVGAGDLRFADLFSSLLRRISMLTYFHTETPLEVDFRGLVDAARATRLTRTRLAWRDGIRRSSRQGRAMPMGGVVGTMDLDRNSIEPFWAYLWLAQWTHVGHMASMGLGRLRLAGTASLPDSR